MKAGDIIAFSGKGWISNIIKWKTRSPVSHVGMILRSDKIIESTTLTERSGVMIRDLYTRLAEYDGEAWLLSLRDDIRARLDTVKMYRFLVAQEGKAYDSRQAVLSAMLWYTFESSKSLFCSELCAMGLEAGGVWSGNASEMTPRDIVDLSDEEGTFYGYVEQIKGEPKSIW